MKFTVLLKQTITIMVMSIFLSSTIIADDVKYNDSWGQQGFNLVNSEKAGVNIIHSVSSFNLTPMVINGESLTTINMPGVLLPNDEGAPNLPGEARYIAIPIGDTAKLNVLILRIETYQNIEME